MNDSDRRSPRKTNLRSLANPIAQALRSGGSHQFLRLLEPYFGQRISFSQWDHVGRALASWAVVHRKEAWRLFDSLVDREPAQGSVVAATALISVLGTDVASTVEKVRMLIERGATWYVCDIFGTRVLGVALLRHFDETLPILHAWVDICDVWVRRTVGVVVHYFAKRAPDQRERHRLLIRLLLRQIESRELHVVKGAGWGLETIGKFNPDLLVEVLRNELPGKSLSATMRRKLLAKLPPAQQEELSAVLEGSCNP